MERAQELPATGWRSDADALYLIGTAYVATGETDKAETTLRAAVAFVPIGWAEPYTAMADAFTKDLQHYLSPPPLTGGYRSKPQ